MFVSYCAAMAGVPRTVLKFSTTAKVHSFGFGGSNPLPGSQLKGFYDLAVKGGSYFPQPGDVIFYASYNTEGTPSASEGKHVGFVESCEAEYAMDGSVSRMVINTIEGNSSDSVKRHSWKMTADSSGWVYSGTYIYAFGIPNYTESGLQSYSNYDIGAYGGTLLRKGNSSEAVRRLQVALNLAEYFDPQGNACTVTGTFDEGTYEAVCNYQRAHSLEVDGIVGNDTWTALRRQLVGCTSRLESDFLVENGRILLYMEPSSRPCNLAARERHAARTRFHSAHRRRHPTRARHPDTRRTNGSTLGAPPGKAARSPARARIRDSSQPTSGERLASRHRRSGELGA